VSGETAGQLAYEHRLALAIADGRTMPGWASQTAAWRQGWEDTAQVGHAAIAAQEPHAAPEARAALAADLHELIDGYCPDIPMCPKCARGMGELLDLADDYAATGGPDSALAGDNAKLQKERDGLRAQMQAVRRLMADAAANGVIDSRAIVDLLAAAPAEPKPAPELAAALGEPRELRKVITELLSMFKGISGGYGARTSSSRLRKIAARAGVHWDSLTLPAPDTTEAAETKRLREALENVFAVLDRQPLTYAERISYARTLIRTARDGQ
jgi:hypothetical protein